MVKSTVRFPDEVIDEVESLVDEGRVTSRSEFQRFAVEYTLSQIDDDYTPEMLDYAEVRDELLPEEREGPAGHGAEENEFLKVAARVRQFAVRGDVETAEDLIDTSFSPTDPRSMLLEDLLEAYREESDTADADD